MDRFTLIENLNYEDPGQISAQTLAYVGDAVYELYIRGRLIAKGLRKSKQLHSKKVSYAKASAQRKAYDKIYNILDETERSIASRGRNAKSGSVPKNARPSDYSHATAFEALIGYHYLKNNRKRLLEILEKTVGEI